MKLLSFARIAVTFAFSFTLAKGTAFLAAMAIPRLVDAPSYGAIELAMTIGALCASVAGVGIPTASARLYLVDKDPRAELLLASNALWLAAAGLCATFTAALLGYDTWVICSVAILGLYGLQFSASTFTRMRGFIHFSGWFDNIVIMLVCILLAIFAARERTDLGNFSRSLVALSTLVAVGAAVVLVRRVPPQFGELAKHALVLGFPMMLFGTATLLLFGTLRIAIDRALTLSDVAAYSLCARITLVLVFVSQILSTGFFRQLYQMESAEISKIFTVWIVALASVASAMALVAHYTADILVIGTAIPATLVTAIFPSVATQTVLWILNANLEIYIVRELLSRRAALIFVGTAAAGACAGLLLHWAGLLGLATLINLYSVAMVAVLLMQMRLLSRKGLRFERAYLALPLVAAPMLVALLP
jgi:O-antigen/teichoic acid export membrane protein